MLTELPADVLNQASNDPEYLHHYDVVTSKFLKEINTKKGWFSENIVDLDCLPIAYFSAEYGLQHSLPFYAGGLGFEEHSLSQQPLLLDLQDGLLNTKGHTSYFRI